MIIFKKYLGRLLIALLLLLIIITLPITGPVALCNYYRVKDK
jgi:hypothetical protein